ncbi:MULTISPECIES: EscU/YscU/HrcU family type III secretion system export apparatus switch protein [unclassified Virgibacillus]|uniref:EscU/YscU/HrcU family type III secretion system export apparatus switch protein n=1 Tax=unclassified Virgibacillus TaxID=2620237 RepID=UPI0024DE2010|nr:EscU/YscU/HrcU family type III secretion system export apparatus switch protein [Virgibacillus sp. LDC-1]
MNEKRQKAAALQYDVKKSHAPKVTAIGKGLVADNIIAEAKKANVPILEDPSLVELLAKLNINETIPAELYQVVAEVFAFVYRTDQEIDL